MTYKMNGIPQLGGGDDKKPKTLESKVNDFLGNPKRAVSEIEARYSSDEGGKFDKGRDRARHMTTAQYTTEGIRNKLDIIFGTGSNLFSHILFEGRAKWLVGGYTKPDLMVEKKSTVTSAFKGLKVGFEMGLEEVWPPCCQNVTNTQPICKLDQVFISSRTLSQPIFDMDHILQV